MVARSTLARTMLIALVSGLLLAAACSDDDDDVDPGATPTASATEGATSEATATTPATTAPEATSEPMSDLEIEVGDIQLTNIRIDPPGGSIGPGDTIHVTADIESSFDGELRVFVAPLSDDPEAFRCMTSDGNQAFTLGSGTFERGFRPVEIREGCPLPSEAVTVTGLQVRVFELDDEGAGENGTLPVEITIDPALVALVDIDGWRYRPVSTCQVMHTVGLTGELSLLEAVSPRNPDPWVGFEWWLDEGATGYVVQRGPGGDVLEGVAGAVLETALFEGRVSTDETVLYARDDEAESEPIALLRAHARAEGGCPHVTHHADASTDPSDFSGRWGYGVLEACTPAAGGDGDLDLWLSDGASLALRGSGDDVEATFVTREGEELALIAGAGSSVDASDVVISATLLMAPGGDASATPQRVAFELNVEDAPCRTSSS